MLFKRGKWGESVTFQNTLKAIADPTRRKILNLLKDGRMTAGEISHAFQMTGATISHHLTILKNADLVSMEKQGKYIYYELNTSVLEDVISWISTLKG